MSSLAGCNLLAKLCHTCLVRRLLHIMHVHSLYLQHTTQRPVTSGGLGHSRVALTMRPAAQADRCIQHVPGTVPLRPQQEAQHCQKASLISNMPFASHRQVDSGHC